MALDIRWLWRFSKIRLRNCHVISLRRYRLLFYLKQKNPNQYPRNNQNHKTALDRPVQLYIPCVLFVIKIQITLLLKKYVQEVRISVKITKKKPQYIIEKKGLA